MCHQSVGLIARALEASGITTTSISSAWSITQSASPPRAVFTDYPLGNTVGPPNDSDTQLVIARAALSLAQNATEPGVIVPLDVAWHEEWKAEARALIDHRTPRNETPQYERMADMAAAIENHGEELACPSC